jgi:CP family cyanate transporter-like MFS transporter
VTISGVYRAIVAVGIVMLAFNLRAAVVAISPLLHQIQAQLGLSASSAGLLTTLPVACFGLFSPVAPALAHRFGIERTLFGATIVLVVAFVLRLLPTTLALYAGTVLAGMTIAIGNVLVPALIKRDFPRTGQRMTAAYVTSLSLGPACAAGLTVPIERAFGLDWRSALFVWVAVPVVTLVLWLPQLRAAHRIPTGARVSFAALTRSRLAWHVTLFMGVQSLGFYVVVAWLPTVYIAHGLDAGAAGGLLSLASLVGIPVVLLTPLVSARLRDQQPLVWLMTGCYAIGLAGVLFAPLAAPALWSVALGVAQAFSIILAITFIVARSPDGAHAAQLSSMAQGIGYTMAAFGPFIFGLLRDLSGGYSVPIAAVFLLLVPLVITGLGAAQPRTIDLAAAAAAR